MPGAMRHNRWSLRALECVLRHKRRPRDDKPTHLKGRQVPAQPAQQQRPGTAETFFKKKKENLLKKQTTEL